MLASIERILKEAGELALSFADNVRGVRKKDRSLVSEADLAVEKFIVSRLRAAFPDDAVIGEEFGGEAAPPRARLWAVDP